MERKFDVETARKIRRNRQDSTMLLVYQSILTGASWITAITKDSMPADEFKTRVLQSIIIATALAGGMAGYGVLRIEAETRKILKSIQDK